MLKQKRCIICKELFQPSHPSSIICSNLKCKEIRHRQKNTDNHRNKAMAKYIEDAKDLLSNNGYIVIGKINGYKIILEPIEKLNNSKDQ